MKKLFFYLTLANLFLGCTQVVTVPISVAGSVVGATIDIGSAAVGAVVSSDDEEKENKD